MRPASIPLDQIRIASPCKASWAAMKGDDKVRFCGQCNLNVYNLSALSRTDAEALIQEKEGRLCVRFFRRLDGTVLTADCPVGFRLKRRALARTLAAAGIVLGLFMGIATALGLPRSMIARLRTLEPFCRLPSPVKPPILMGTMGEIAGRISMPPQTGSTNN